MEGTTKGEKFIGSLFSVLDFSSEMEGDLAGSLVLLSGQRQGGQMRSEQKNNILSCSLTQLELELKCF